MNILQLKLSLRRPLKVALLLTAFTTGALAQDTGGPTPDAGFYTGQSGTSNKGIEWVQAITVSAPAYCSDIKGDVTVTFAAPGMTKAEALCWQQPTADNPGTWGHDAVVATVPLDATTGNGSFVFHADQFPHGPIMLRIHAKDDGKKQDLCQLQLFNQGGVVWNQGIPKTDPPAAKGMKLAFADDFNSPLSISATGAGATYEAHKTGGGDFSGWPFSNNEGAMNPFSQVETWLRIHASKNADGKASSGIISSAHQDGTGILATAPCYFECRFLAQSAPGTWPAFWVCSKKETDRTTNRGPCDELDVIEAYGGVGPRNPNFMGYAATSHFWAQPAAAWTREKGPDGKPRYETHANVPIMDLGGKSTWSATFHTYGVLITPTDTVYYFDDIPVLRHPSGELSKSTPTWFLINYAIGGISGWPIDLKRYGNQSDMWVDYVRVYQGEKAAGAAADASAPEAAANKPENVNIASDTNLADSVDKVTLAWLKGSMKWGKVGTVDAQGVETPWLGGAVPPETPGTGGSRFGYTAEGMTTGGKFQSWTANGKMPIKPGDKLFVYVFLDPTDPPFEILLQLHAHDSYSHRAFWGTRNMITHMDPVQVGPIPETGKWVRLEVDPAQVGRTGIMWLPGMK